MAAENTRATKTQEEQWIVQNQVFRIYDLVCQLPPHAQSVNFEIRRDNHIEYLTKSLQHLGPNFVVLDANRPWLCYWIIHSIALLGDYLDDNLEHDVVDFLRRCQDPNGGYGGGPGQLPHLATTYAAINVLITVGGQRSLSSINRKSLYAFLLRMKDRSGGFRMHDGGEIDVRACYTAISVASVLNILDDQLIQHVGDYILSCQTYEGGISGEPGSEAHGGYTFCGLAAMVLINEVNRLDLPRLINWVIFRQGVECGFQGRTNKLVDGCYSFWQGGVAAICQRLHSNINEQLGLPHNFNEEYSSDSEPGSINSDLSEGDQCSETSSSAVNDTCQPSQAGTSSATTPVGVNNCGQGGVAAICQRLHSNINEQLGLPHNFNEEYSSDSEPGSINSDLSEGDQCSETSSSAVNDTCQPSQAGTSSATTPVGVNNSGHSFIRGPGGTRPLFNSMALQQYILLCAQEEAGFRDKPGKCRDHYHTCYVLSGLSVCQHSSVKNADSPPLPGDVMGPYSNLLEPIHLLHNVVLDKYFEAHEFFRSS